MINDYKKEFMYARVFEAYAFGIKWAQKFKSKEHPLPIGQYWHVDLFFECIVYDKETVAPDISSYRNPAAWHADDWMDADWAKAFYKRTPPVQ